MVWQATVGEEEIPLGTCQEVLAGDEPVLVVRTGQGVFACAAYCPHKAMQLESGEIHGTTLTCPLHAATFDLTTGDPQDETDWAGQLPVYACEVREGIIHIDVPVDDEE